MKTGFLTSLAWKICLTSQGRPENEENSEFLHKNTINNFIKMQCEPLFHSMEEVSYEVSHRATAMSHCMRINKT